MLNEPSALSEPSSEPVASSTPANDLRSHLRSAVDGVFLVDVEDDSLPEPITVSYTGTLMMDSLEAYNKLDEAFKPLDHVPVFLTQDGHQVVRAVRGRFKPRPRPVWPNALLFGLTIVSVLFAGAASAGSLNPLDGWQYALGLIL